MGLGGSIEMRGPLFQDKGKGPTDSDTSVGPLFYRSNLRTEPMSTKLYTHIRDTPTENLLVILEFFDSPNLREYYTGLIGDVRKELTERGVCPPPPNG